MKLYIEDSTKFNLANYNGGRFSCDYIGPSRAWAHYVGIEDREIGEYLLYARTIGGHMIWPVHRIPTINTARAGGGSLFDRIDLTLYEIQRFYLGDVDKLCRSPISEYVLKDMVEKRGLTDAFEIASAATSTEEIWNGKGNPIYPPAQAELRRHGIGETAYTNFSGKRARQVTKQDYLYYDYLLCADSNNIRNTLRITGPDKEGKVKLLLDFTDRPGRSIADPWYTGNFEETYRDVYEGCTALLEALEK